MPARARMDIEASTRAPRRHGGAGILDLVAAAGHLIAIAIEPHGAIGSAAVAPVT
jgi:hypothetical protein